MSDENKSSYDIAVIGAGPGGYTAAIRAAQLGKKVVLIEKDEVGGVCLNHGCIPTKSIIYSTTLHSKIKRSSYFGINADNVSIDLGKIIDRKDRIVGQLRKGLQYLFKENRIDLIKGEAKLIDNNHIEVAGQKIHAIFIILATGSGVPKQSHFKIDEMKVFSSNGILNLKVIPKTMAIIGAGAIGIEMACIFNELGTKVTVYEIMPRILPLEDVEVSSELEKILTGKGIDIKTSSTLRDINEHEIILISIGRSLNTDGFEAIGVKIEKGKVAVNERMQTSVMNIFAIGDIAGKYMFAHTASREGIVAVEAIAGHKVSMDYSAVPRCTYSSPGIGSVGLTEEEARKRFGEIKVGKFPYSALSKSLIEDSREGFVKIICDKGGKVVGAHILGALATEMIAEAALAIQNRLNVEAIINTIHAHPTIYESVYEAAENVLKKSISILNK